MPKNKKKTKAEHFKLERTVQRVRHKFIDDELIGLGYSMGQKIRNLKIVESEKKSVAADYAAREKSLALEVDEMSRKLNDGWEMRDKPCFVFKDFATDQVYWFLCDDLIDFPIETQIDADEMLAHLLADESWEPVKQRRLRESEKQGQLFDGDDNPEGDKGQGGKDNEPEVITD
jgi:hypothetical protein